MGIYRFILAVMQILNSFEYEDRGLTRTAIYWTDGKRTWRADTHCSLTGAILATTLEACVAHCREHGHYTAELDALFHMCVVDRRPVEDLEKYIKAHSLYPQSTPLIAEIEVNL